jgi:hypothetical protein
MYYEQHEISAIGGIPGNRNSDRVNDIKTEFLNFLRSNNYSN